MGGGKGRGGNGQIQRDTTTKFYYAAQGER